MSNWMICAAVAGTLLAGSPALAQKVNVDSNPAAAFTSYRTYTWAARQDVQAVPATFRHEVSDATLI